MAKIKEKDEFLLKKHNIEMIAVCKKCYKTWCSLNEWEIITECETCKTGQFLEQYCVLEDVLEVLRKND